VERFGLRARVRRTQVDEVHGPEVDGAVAQLAGEGGFACAIHSCASSRTLEGPLGGGSRALRRSPSRSPACGQPTVSGQPPSRRCIECAGPAPGRPSAGFRREPMTRGRVAIPRDRASREAVRSAAPRGPLARQA
jgi:hypothetical protein